MIHSCLIAASLSLPAQEPAAAPAEKPSVTYSSSLGIVSNYVFRGLTQTATQPALQGGVTATLDCNFYVGAWGSNVSWISDAYPGTSSSLELDIFAGYKHALCEGVDYDIGLLRYQYPGDFGGVATEPQTTELYGALTWKMLTLKTSVSLGDTFGVDNSSGTWYADLSGNFQLPKDFALGLHVGHQEYAGSIGGTSNDSLYSYSDYSATLSHPIGQGFTLGFTFSHADTEDAGYTLLGDNIGETQYVFSLVKSF